MHAAAKEYRQRVGLWQMSFKAMTLRIGYGLNPDAPHFSGLPPRALAARLQAQGFDGVFLKRVEPSWVEGLKAGGLRVYASLGVFAGAGLWASLPESRPVTSTGAPAPKEDWYEPAIPTLPALRERRLSELANLLASPLDGIWLDFIRWPARWERPHPRLYHSSFDPVTLRQFQEDSGLRWPPNSRPAEVARWLLGNAAESWFAWRCQQVTSFVAEARALLQQQRPEALLGVFTVPWTADDAPIPQANLRVLGQDVAALAPHVDVFSPMTYHRLCAQDTRWIARVARWVAAQSQRPVWPVIEAIESDKAYTAAQFTEAFQAAAEAAKGGVIAFSLEGLLADAGKLTAWRAT